VPKPIVQEIRLLDKTKKGFSSITRSMSTLKGGLAGLGAAVSVGGFAKIVSASIDAADNINNLSIRLGASTEALSQYQLVAESTGVTFQTLTTGWQRMTRRIAEAANGTGEAKDALRELGLSAQDLNNLKPEQQFELIADAMGGVGKQSDKVRLAMKLFDTEGVSLLQTMEGGSAAMRKMRADADALGKTLDKETAQSAAEANKAMVRLGAVFQGVGKQIVAALAPAITAVVNWLTVAIPKAVKVVGDAFNSLIAFISKAGSGITYVLAAIENDLSSLAAAAGFDTLSKGFKRAANDYYSLSKNLEGFALSLGKSATAQDLLNDALGDGVTYTGTYNAGLAEQTAREKELAKQRAASAKLAQQRLKSIQDYVANLQKEADTLGFTNAQLREYELRQLGASSAQIQLTLGLQAQIDAFNEQQKAMEGVAQSRAELEQFASALTRSVNPAQEVADQLAKIEDAFAAGLISADTYGEAIFAAMDNMGDATDKAAESADKLKSLGDELGPVIADSFGDAIIEAKSFKDVLKGLEQDLLRVLTRSLITRPLTDALGNFLGGSGGFNIGALFGRAVGGPVASNQPYVVGENGPELFVPSTNGRIETNTPGATINVVVQGVQDAGSFVRNQSQVARAAGLALRQAQAAV